MSVKNAAKILKKIKIISSHKEKKFLMQRLTNSSTPIILAFINAHAVNLMVNDDRFYKCMAIADILLRDGKGIEILLNFKKKDPGMNMNGTDFIPDLLREVRGKTIGVYATESPWIDRAISTLRREGQTIVDAQNGFQSYDFYIDQVKKFKPEVLILGMGMPKQEMLAKRIRNEINLNGPKLIICGGAVIDFYAERFNRAPLFMRNLGIEWLYRFSKEPVRLFTRYFIGNALFIFRIRTLIKLMEKV
jgi:exopolysaccharide biosynthesis WecB/TagA/CpsF family protein